MSATRYRVWSVVLVLHLLLGAWLVTVTDRTVEQAPPGLLDAMLIQQVAVAPPAPQPQTAAAQRTEPSQWQPQRAVTPPVTTRQSEPVPASKPRLAPLPSPVPNPPREVTPPAPTPTPKPATATATAQPVPEPPSTATAPAATAATAAALAPATVAGTAVSNSAAPAKTAAGESASASGAIGALASAARPAASTDITVACPGQVAPVMPRLAIRGGVTGEVVAQALIVGGKVTEVRILSGPSVFHNAVRAAMLQYRCVTSAAEVRVTQQFTFRLE